MSQLVEHDQLIREAYQELKRFSANSEMRENERRRQRFLADYHLSMGAAQAEGRAEGKAEGRAEGKIEDIISFLEVRFGQTPPSLADALRPLSESLLRTLLFHAAKCESLNDFEKELKNS
jgi:hypothetical protein